MAEKKLMNWEANLVENMALEEKAKQLAKTRDNKFRRIRKTEGEVILALYERGDTHETIATLLGRSRPTISNWLNRSGVK